MKKLINDVQDVLDEQLAGLAKAHPSLTLHQDPVYVTVVISVRGCFRGPVRAKFSPHRRPIKSLNAPCKLMAAKVYC